MVVCSAGVGQDSSERNYRGRGSHNVRPVRYIGRESHRTVVCGCWIECVCGLNEKTSETWYIFVFKTKYYTTLLPSNKSTRNVIMVPSTSFTHFIIIINPLTARVVGTPQMILQPVFYIFSFLHCLLGLAELQALSLIHI